MPLAHSARAAMIGVTLLTVGWLAPAPAAAARPETATEHDGAACVQRGPTLRYVVLFPRGTATEKAEAEITAKCGATTVYYPQVAVAVATSPDPSFGERFGVDRAFSAQGTVLARRERTRRQDETSPRGESRPRRGAPTAADRSGEQWDMAMIRADQARRVNPGSRDVVVGVLDSGVDATHPDLARAVDPSLSVGCLTGRPNPSPAAWAPTTSVHGTHVAGTIAAADDGRGVTGVAPGVRLASVKVVDDQGYIFPEYAVCGLLWAAETGMRVVNNSYYVDPWMLTCRNREGERVVHEAVRRAVEYANDRGVLVVAATGNAGVDLSRPGRGATVDEDGHPVDSACDVLPAKVRGVVAVSSVGAKRLKAGYSSYGLGVVQVTAPGGDYRQEPTAGGNGCVLSTVPGGYDYTCGTSMATPHVTGVAALLASTHPSATASQLARLLNAQARPVPCPADYDLNGDGAQDAVCHGATSYNGFYGHGIVDALAAVTSGED
ncbi:Subtilase family protein [Streptoalloteichus tenebrarius]|uniref:Subtilase family protein n=1 Tax=Streptoalloteichus tenebrarius (strain ATCC 17920 / DSM 40477 / JCM 4838 / CBS 697.72 / NBRC 16177 / NCIMB 11028 / NRRL B-12390 / A12253. 1 / ISP 5477) TaxID=1933 RepID=A0ABT1HX85_STRSD|nr:S8 family serine peptidase [Streptoalloteichus tenebrarius]MCP2260133.1 Subtilase family protein [Streptoalloteichus tenebrarius]